LLSAFGCTSTPQTGPVISFSFAPRVLAAL